MNLLTITVSKLTAVGCHFFPGGFVRTTLHSSRSQNRSLFAAVVAVLALVLSLLTVAPAQALSDTGTGGVFVPASGRVLDTKYNTGGYNTPMSGGAWRTVKIAGNAGIPDDGSVGAVAVTAVILDTSYGQLRGRPNADTATTLMSIYAGGGATSTSNSSIVALNDDGTLQVMTSTDARLVLDVQGYYTSSDDGTAAGGFVPVAGTRIVDTRSGTGLPKAVVASGDTKTIQVTGNAGVPAGASGVVVTMIAVNKEAKIGTLTPFAYGAPQPKNSFQYQESQDTAMSAQVALSANGKLSINNTGSSTDLVVDVQGYFTAAGKGGAMFTPAAGRAYDTRAGSNTALGNNESRSIQLAGVAGVPVMGSGITAVVITLTAVHSADSEGRAIVWADGTTRPAITSMDYVAGSTRSNTVTVPLGANGKISLYNNGTATEYVIDVQGWYSNPSAPVISCPNPYGAGSWTKTLPSSAITCSVLAPLASSSADVVRVTLDDEDYQSVNLSSSSKTAVSVSVEPDGGRHEIQAVVVSNGSVSPNKNSYSFGLGDWAKSTLVPEPGNGVETDLLPYLNVDSAVDTLDPGVHTTFSVSTSSDGVTNPVYTSDGSATSTDVPRGVLQADTNYFWTATLVGPSGGSSTPVTVQTDVWSFTARACGKLAERQDGQTAEDEARAQQVLDDYCNGTTVVEDDEDATAAAPSSSARTLGATIGRGKYVRLEAAAKDEKCRCGSKYRSWTLKASASGVPYDGKIAHLHAISLIWRQGTQRTWQYTEARPVSTHGEIPVQSGLMGAKEHVYAQSELFNYKQKVVDRAITSAP